MLYGEDYGTELFGDDRAISYENVFDIEKRMRRLLCHFCMSVFLLVFD